MFWKNKTSEEERVNKIIPLLKESDIGKRLSSVSSLVELNSNSQKILLKFLKNDNVRIRTSTAFAISRIISKPHILRKELIDQVVELLNHKDSRMRYYAAGLLGRIATDCPAILEASMPRIMSLFWEYMAEERNSTIKIYPHMFVLGEIGSNAPQLIEYFIPQITRVLDKKELAVYILDRISLRNPKLLKDSTLQLEEFIRKTDDWSSSETAAMILARISKSSPELTQQIWTYALSLLNQEFWLNRLCAIRLIGEISLEHPELIINILYEVRRLTMISKEQHEYSVSCYNILVLGRMSSKSPILAEKLAPILKDYKDFPWSMVRGFTAVSLRYIFFSSPELISNVLPKLLEKFQDKHKTALGVAAIGSRLLSKVPLDVVSDILSSIADEASWKPDVLQTVLWAFATVFQNYRSEIDKALIPQIGAFLENKRSDIRSMAVGSIVNIAKICPDDVIELLPKIMELLNDSDSYVRSNAAIALYEFAVRCPNLINEITVQRLIELLEDKDWGVHSSVMLPLSRLI